MILPIRLGIGCNNLELRCRHCWNIVSPHLSRPSAGLRNEIERSPDSDRVTARCVYDRSITQQEMLRVMTHRGDVLWSIHSTCLKAGIAQGKGLARVICNDNLKPFGSAKTIAIIPPTNTIRSRFPTMETL
jgi:hypothetical protein